jgi:hypothetical protein
MPGYGHRMSVCVYCRRPGADLFDPNGNLICQACDAGFKAQLQQSRADAQVAADPIGSHLTFASPKTLFRAGIGVISGSVLLGILEVFFVGRVHVILLGGLFVSGAAALWRSWD